MHYAYLAETRRGLALQASKSALLLAVPGSVGRAGTIGMPNIYKYYPFFDARPCPFRQRFVGLSASSPPSTDEICGFFVAFPFPFVQRLSAFFIPMFASEPSATSAHGAFRLQQGPISLPVFSFFRFQCPHQSTLQQQIIPFCSTLSVPAQISRSFSFLAMASAQREMQPRPFSSRVTPGSS